MEEQKYDYGMIGLGTMGRNLMYNICDHGFSVAGFVRDQSKKETLNKEKGNYKILVTHNLYEFLNALKKPRVILLLVPAGPAVDDVINELTPLISANDLIIDCGNSHFTDTDRRIAALAKSDIKFMGAGISGGESGARNGPSIMPGGAKDAYERVATLFESVSAKVNNEPCVTYMGLGSAGHYVKMVHNGIEYALMQLIAETYHLLKALTGMTNNELSDTFSAWNTGPLQSYLVSITAGIFTQQDDLSSNYLVDMILDSAHQKGTGMWVSQDAMNLQAPIPAIDAAVSARDLSAYKKERVAASHILKGPQISSVTKNKKEFIKSLEQALYFSMITAFSQGMSLLHRASAEYKYELRLEEIAKIWRGGCIIRAAVLEDIRSVFQQKPELQNLMMHDAMAGKLSASEDGMRFIVKSAAESGIPIPAFMASLAYFDGYRNEWLPSNLLQAQRDYFGAHTYQRTDRNGDFHLQWNQTS